MDTHSRKAKGRSLQNLVRDTFRSLFKDFLEDDDILSRPMSSSGTDIILTPAAKKLIPFDIECKRQEKLNIHAALKQSQDNTSEGRIALLIFSKNHTEPYVALKFSDFIKIFYK